MQYEACMILQKKVPFFLLTIVLLFPEPFMFLSTIEEIGQTAKAQTLANKSLVLGKKRLRRSTNF